MSHVYAVAEPPADPRQLTRDNLGLAYKVASTFTRRARAVGLDDEDLRQEAVIGLMRSAAAFDPAKGFAFSTLAFRVIRHHLLGVLAKRRYRQLLGLPTDRDGEPLPFEEKYAEPADSCAELDDERALVQQLLSTLLPRERAIVELRYFEGLGLAEVGDRLVISKERARQIEARALLRLRRAAGQAEAGALASSAG